MDIRNHDIETINSLIKTTIDSVDGYRSAAEDADSGQFQSIFFERANERQRVAEELRQHVRSLGGDPQDDGSVLAGAHRAFMNLRDAVTGRDDQAIIAEVERGEDHIKEKFEAAMQDGNLGTETRSLISQCYDSVKSGHDQMRDLKNGMRAV
ncbi:PA2169 family four-helix-bundle protein [Sphingorhabdus sp.]|uniref:PA2169 family four-helix-bundle protein n=1 Tax=Sphingorhabdus sp. TaxID=1902408 RepID=UPI00391BAEB5